MRLENPESIEDIGERLRFARRLLDPFPFAIHNHEPIEPFFIVGSGRCGTTLLRRLLVSGPGHVHIPPENWSLRAVIEVFRKYRLVADWGDIADLCIAQLLSSNQGWFEHYPSDLKETLVALEGKQRTLAGLIDATYRFHGHTVMEKVDRWGDKTPLNVGLMPELIHIFPKCKFVFMLRDPADTTYSCSFLEQYRNDVIEPAKRWLAALESRQWFEDKYPDSILTVRYEDLVQNADSELRRVCDFLALEFHPSMLASRADREQLSDLKTHVHHAAAMQSITQSSIGKGRDGLTTDQKAIISALLGDSVSRAGYEPLR